MFPLNFFLTIMLVASKKPGTSSGQSTQEVSWARASWDQSTRDMSFWAQGKGGSEGRSENPELGNPGPSDHVRTSLCHGTRPNLCTDDALPSKVGPCQPDSIGWEKHVTVTGVLWLRRAPQKSSPIPLRHCAIPPWDRGGLTTIGQ